MKELKDLLELRETISAMEVPSQTELADAVDKVLESKDRELLLCEILSCATSADEIAFVHKFIMYVSLNGSFLIT